MTHIFTLKKRLLIAFSAIVVFFTLHNQDLHAQNAQEKPARILFLVDASGSMSEIWLKKESRFQAASRIISGIMDSINNLNQDVAFAVRVFGAEYPSVDENCFDTKLEVPFRNQNHSQIKTRLQNIRPKGFSPIAYSLKETAEKDFIQSNQYAYSIILITDGGESCDGDICATMQLLLSKKISFKPYILSLIEYEPLREMYECLGNYLSITTENDIVPAIQKIMDDNKNFLLVKAPGLKASVSRPVKREDPPRPIQRVIRTQPEVIEKEIIEEEMPIVEVEPEVIKEEEMPIVEIEPEVMTPQQLDFTKMPVYLKPSKLGILYTLPELNKIRTDNLPKIKIEIEEPEEAPQEVVIETVEMEKPVANNTAPKPRTTIVPATSEFNTIVEDAEKTGLQIFFTDGKGKFYDTQPQIKILESTNKNEVKSTFRNVSGGQPQIIEIDPGSYDIVIPNTRASALNVPIVPNKTNKVYIIAGRGSIAFIHPTAPDRPIDQYRALVSQRFVKGSPVVNHPCTEELPYEPSNYHVEINTLPPLIYNVNVAFSEIKLLSIPEPGMIEITNKTNFNEVQFWHLLGDRYIPFYEMQVNGDPSKQKAEFLPGNYQIRYYKQPERPYQKAEVISFRIISNQVTQITLAN